MIRSTRTTLIGLFGLIITCAAGPSQEDVFKSISQNVGNTNDSKMVLIFLMVTAGFIILLVIFNQRKQNMIAPKVLNHHGKLMKEVSRGLSLRPAEIKQLRLLADETTGRGGEPVSSPLSLLLCPSVLAAAAKSRRTAANQKVLEQIRRKMLK